MSHTHMSAAREIALKRFIQKLLFAPVHAPKMAGPWLLLHVGTRPYLHPSLGQLPIFWLIKLSTAWLARATVNAEATTIHQIEPYIGTTGCIAIMLGLYP